jgi:hypothetical protein
MYNSYNFLDNLGHNIALDIIITNSTFVIIITNMNIGQNTDSTWFNIEQY